MSTALALSSYWLNRTADAYVSSGVGTANYQLTKLPYPTPWPYPSYYYPWPAVTTTVTVSPDIILKMSEVERLREAAQDDAELKRILQKFTPYIQVVVDFD